jgi:phage tail sheath protein FI
VTSWDKFADAETTDVSLLISGPVGSTTQKHVIQQVAEKRLDAVAFVSPIQADVNPEPLDATKLTNVLEHRNDDLNVDSSYAVMDSGWKYQFDKYNNVYRWVPLNPDIAGLCARTDRTRDAWWSPAGFNRGQIKNVIKLAWNPKKAHRDDLYRAGVNPVATFPGQGTVLFGDKTLQSKPSAFDRINVRRLFIVLEKAISTSAKFSLFEFNDEFTRAQFRNMVEPFLRDVQGRRGITDFKVVCDESNNTAGVIDRNEFVGDIYVKPNRSINYIQLNFVAVRTGVDFSEIVGQF